MFCKFCGNKIDDKTIFCPNCGNKVSEKLTSEKNEPFKVAEIKPSPENSDNEKSQGEITAAKEIMMNLKLVLLAFAIGCVSYLVWYQIKEPYYVPQDVLEKNMKALQEQMFQGGSAMYQVGWIGYSEYDDGIRLEDVGGINEIRKSAFLNDIQSKSIMTFVIALVALIIGRYLIKGLGWANETAKTE